MPGKLIFASSSRPSRTPDAPRPVSTKPETSPKDAVKKSGSAPPKKSQDSVVDNGNVWRVSSINIEPQFDNGKDDFSIQPAVIKSMAKKVGCNNPSKLQAEDIKLVRKSFDARKAFKRWSYVVDINESVLKKAGAKNLAPKPGMLELLPTPSNAFGSLASAGGKGIDKKSKPVVVVGSGPSGLFAALTLAEAGINVVLLEQGRSVEERGKDIGRLMVRREGNSDSNICFGEGGAGTYSDGKLTTRIGRNSEAVRYVLQKLVDFGGPEEILLSGKPHLGSDRLVRILRSFRQRLQSLGATIRFSAKVTDLLIGNSGKVTGVQLEDGTEIAAEKVVLAVGHSAREIYYMLHKKDVALTAKPFAMGFRIEHPQVLIDTIQYGQRDGEEQVMRGKGPFPVADYRLATQIACGGAAYENKLKSDATTLNRGVFSFCMCPGGQIVPTSTNPDELCINGMSFSRRNSQWANSALVATVEQPDWEHLTAKHGPLAAMQLQREIERKAAALGGGNYTCPVQRVPDFLNDTMSQLPLPSSSYRLGVTPAPLHTLYAPPLTAAFKTALAKFDGQMAGYVSENALLHAAETRTSSAVRIERGETSLQSVNVEGLYPCAEGAGYAGGIVSAAVDGLRVGRIIAAQLLGISSAADDAMFVVGNTY